MRLMLSFFRAYPLPTLLMLAALLLSALAEGVGLSTLLPLLNIVLKTGAGNSANAAAPSELETAVLNVLDSIGIPLTLGYMLSIIIAGVALKSLFLLLAQRQVGYTAARVATDLRLELLRTVLRSRWGYFLHQPAGKLTNSLATEAQRSSASFVYGATAITYLIQATIYMGVAFLLSWQASLAAIGVGVTVIGLLNFLVRITRRAGRKQTRLLSSLISNLTDMLQSVKPLKAMGREHLADTVLASDTNRLKRALRKQVLSGAVLDSAQELMFAALICIGIYAAIGVYDMELSTVMVLVVALGRGFVFLSKVQKQYQKLAQGESAYWSMKDTISDAASAEEPQTGGGDPQLEKAIEFKSVSFDYDGRHPVFSDLSLRFEAGSLTALAGPSGVGKTTIVDLVIGLLQPRQGSVELDGVDLRDIDIRAWRNLIGYVPQDTILLHDSILHNLTLGDSALDATVAEEALKAAGAWEFVSQLPAGLDTVVGERGGKLSGGQRQRIVIARALMNRPKLLILDEATSALDPETEEAVRQTMISLRGGLTILAISHNHAMLEAADKVYHLPLEKVSG